MPARQQKPTRTTVSVVRESAETLARSSGVSLFRNKFTDAGAISNATDGVDQTFFSGLIDLLSQQSDKCVEIIALDIAVESPHASNQALARDGLAHTV